MTLDDFDEFAQVIVGFAELKGKTLSPAAQKLFFRSMMNDWSIDDFKAAAEHLVKTCEFMPTPKNFEDLRLAGKYIGANEAWALALQSVRRSQSTTGDEFTDRVVQAIGGFYQLGQTYDEDLSYVQHKFLGAYAEMRDAKETRDAVPQLTSDEARRVLGSLGIDDTTNLLK